MKNISTYCSSFKPVLTKWFLLLPLLLLLSGCGKSGKVSDQQTEENAVESSLLKITTDQIKANNLLLGKVTEYEFVRKVSASGYLQALPGNRQTISSWMGGTVRELRLLPGEFVKAGQELCRLENPELLTMQEEYLTSLELLKYLEDDLERQKALADENVTAKKTYLKAKADYMATMAKRASLKSQLQLLKIDPDQVGKREMATSATVYAPISGFVTSVEAHNGQFIEQSGMIMEIVQPTPILLDLNVFEKEIMDIREGQEVTFSLPGISSASYQAKVLKVGKSVDENRTTSVMALFNVPDTLRLLPGMFIQAKIHTGSRVAPALPLTALVTIDEEEFVLVKTNQEKDFWILDKKKVKTGWQDGKMIEIAAGSAIDILGEVVVDGAFGVANN